MASKLTPLVSLHVSRYQIPAHGLLPNTSIQNRPLLIYHSVFPPGTSASSIEKHLKSIGIVVPQWRYSIVKRSNESCFLGVACLLARVTVGSVVVSASSLYPIKRISGEKMLIALARYTTTHYHSTTHELLCIYNGKARLCFGGEENPDRVELVVNEGDVILIPAGVAHRLLEDLNGGFEMVGSYPIGKQWDMCYGQEGEKGTTKEISCLDWFKQDPIYGNGGPAVQEHGDNL